MRFGACTFATEYSMPMADLGPALERRGFESLWLAEHSHIPASRQSPWPGGAELPQFYYDSLDPFVALTMAAAHTHTLKVATGIALVIQRDPIYLAKEVASLDLVSNGRFMLGIGGGWNLEEMRDHGTEPDSRFRRMRETVEAMKALWTQETAEYHGRLIDFEPTFQNPKPVQKPHPPIHVGGSFPGAVKRAVSYGDGWMPIWGRQTDAFPDQLQALHQACDEHGRKREEIEVTVFMAPTEADQIKQLQQLGVDRLLFAIPSVGADELNPILDQLAQLMDGL